MKDTDEEIMQTIAYALGPYFVAHPEVRSIMLRCYSEGDGLLRDFFFSPPKGEAQ
jgi:hypothetical protein